MEETFREVIEGIEEVEFQRAKRRFLAGRERD